MPEILREGFRRLADLAFLGVAALGLGWLVGASRSPVVPAVVASLLAVLLALVAAVRRARPDEGGTPPTPDTLVRSANPRHLAWVVIALVAGCWLGVVTRTRGWMGPDTRAEIERWVALGIDRQTAVQTLFAWHYPQGGEVASPSRGTTLYTADLTACEELRGAISRDDLRETVAAMPERTWREIGRVVDSDAHLTALVEVLCVGG